MATRERTFKSNKLGDIHLISFQPEFQLATVNLRDEVTKET